MFRLYMRFLWIHKLLVLKNIVHTYLTLSFPLQDILPLFDQCHVSLPSSAVIACTQKHPLPYQKTNLLPCQCILVLHSTSKWGKSSFDFRHHLLHQIVLIVQLYAHHDIFELMISLCVVKDVNKRVLQFNLNIFNYITIYKLIFGC